LSFKKNGCFNNSSADGLNFGSLIKHNLQQKKKIPTFKTEKYREGKEKGKENEKEKEEEEDTG
jgi:hypothetical protein